MSANARTKRYTTVSDVNWLTIASSSKSRRVFSMQVGANSSPVYIYVGFGTPNKTDAFLLSALDWWEPEVSALIGPVSILPSTGGTASVVVLEK